MDDLTLKMSTTLLGTKPYLTLYMKVARSCKRRFCRLGRLARSCTLSTFLASEALQKCHIRLQYVKYGNIEDLHKSNFASVGIRFLNLQRKPTLWLAFFSQFTNVFAKYKVFVDDNSEKANVRSTFNDMRIDC